MSADYIKPGSKPDMALVGFKSACEQVLDPRYREAFIAEAMLSDMIREVHELTVQLMGHLSEIKLEADGRALVNDLAERLGGFA